MFCRFNVCNVRLKRYFSNSVIKNTESRPSEFVRLDGKGFERANIRRLRPFFKFLAVHTVIIGGFAYLYKRLEARKIELHSVPLDSVESVINHIWNIISDSYCFIIHQHNTTLLKPIIGVHSKIDSAQSLDDIIKSLDFDKSAELRRVFFSLPLDFDLFLSEVTLLFHSPGRESYIVLKGPAKILSDKIVWKSYWGPKNENKLIELTPTEISIAFVDSDISAKLLSQNDNWTITK